VAVLQKRLSSRRRLTVLETLFEAAVDLLLPLLLALALQVNEALGHLLADLLRGLQVSHELLLINAVLSLKEAFQPKCARVRFDGAEGT
jgi:hypothetical protein